MRLIRKAWLRRAALVLATTAAGWTVPAAAQTLFAWPDTAVDVTRDTTVELCLAATQRAEGQAERREARTSWRDTLPWDPKQRFVPAPAPVEEIAARCSARLQSSTAPLDLYKYYLQLFLAAGRDSDAAVVVTRKLAALSDSARLKARDFGDRGAGAVVDTIIELYMNAQPARLDAAEALLGRKVRGAGDLIQRIQIYDNMMAMAYTTGDTARARILALGTLAAVDSLTPADRASEEFERFFPPPLGIGPMLYDVIVNNLGGEQTKFDSLRRSTTALARLERAWWHQFTQEREGAFPLPIGDTAAPIQGDFWFPDSGRAGAPPRAGQVSLIAFMPACDEDAVEDPALLSANACPEGDFAVLRRLRKRFPSLNITIVGNTRGYFSYMLTRSSAEEADWYRKWVQASAPAGVTIVVDSTPFWRLPSPDARRIDRELPNFAHYTFRLRGSSMAALFKSYQWYLVDQQQLIVALKGGQDRLEPQVVNMIDVLLHRPAGHP